MHATKATLKRVGTSIRVSDVFDVFCNMEGKPAQKKVVLMKAKNGHDKNIVKYYY